MYYVKFIMLNVHRSSCNIPVILIRLYFNNRLLKYTPMSNIMRSFRVGAQLLHARTDGQTDITKLTFTFRAYKRQMFESMHRFLPFSRFHSEQYLTEIC
jgi:hypothetical protein